MSTIAEQTSIIPGPVGPGDALIIVGVQRDYIPGGKVAVPHGDAVVEPLNHLIERFVRADLPIFYVRDWHPANPPSVANGGDKEPVHCVAGTPGAEFAPGLWIAESDPVISLSVPHGPDAASAFEGTPLAQYLRRTGTRRIFVGGLAMEHCVLKTVRDALEMGYEVHVLRDAVRAANLHRGDDRRALRVMRHLGAHMTEVRDILLST
jgi:nicotinamidase/pyrazinamidase